MALDLAAGHGKKQQPPRSLERLIGSLLREGFFERPEGRGPLPRETPNRSGVFIVAIRSSGG